MKDEIRTDMNGSLTEAFEASTKRVLTVDVTKYDKYLEGSGLSADQKEAFLRATWTFVMAFVELGFEVHPLQEVWGKDLEALDRASKTDSNGGKPPKQEEEQRRPNVRPKRGLESG